MDKKQKDRHLDVPAEANRDKHINFIAEERAEVDPAEEPSTRPMAGDPTNDPKKKDGNKEEKNNSKK